MTNARFYMNIEQLIRPNIARLEPYHCAREKSRDGVLLDANENPYGQSYSGVKLNRYPDPYQRELRLQLATYLGVGIENVVAGAGSDEVLDWIFKVFCQPGQDWVAIVEPTYGMYRVTADIYGIPIFEFLLKEDTFAFDGERFLKTAPEQVKVVFLCSPNNPTGHLLDRNEILRLCREAPMVVVVDEAYIEFSSGRSLAEEVNRHANLIVLRTFSKAFARAALRLGYAVASPPAISCFLKVKAPYNVNALTLEKGSQALQRPHRWHRQARTIAKERERVRKRLGGIQGVEKVFPSEANFLLFRCPQASVVCQKLWEKGIVVRDRSSSALLKNCIRVSIGTPQENALFLAALEEVLTRIVL